MVVVVAGLVVVVEADVVVTASHSPNAVVDREGLVVVVARVVVVVAGLVVVADVVVNLTGSHSLKPPSDEDARFFS